MAALSAPLSCLSCASKDTYRHLGEITYLHCLCFFQDAKVTRSRCSVLHSRHSHPCVGTRVGVVLGEEHSEPGWGRVWCEAAFLWALGGVTQSGYSLGDPTVMSFNPCRPVRLLGRLCQGLCELAGQGLCAQFYSCPRSQEDACSGSALNRARRPQDDPVCSSTEGQRDNHLASQSWKRDLGI